MAQGIANACHLRAAFERMGCVRVAKEVRRDGLLNACTFCGRAHDPPCLDGARCSVARTSREHERACGSVSAHCTNKACRPQGDANGAGLVAFAVDGDEHRSVVGVGEIGPSERHDLAHPERSGIEQPDEDVIAPCGEGEHLGDVVFGQDAVSEGIARGRFAERGSDVEWEPAELRSEGEERLHRGDDAPARAAFAREGIAKGLEVAKGDRSQRLADESAEALDVTAVGADSVAASLMEPEGDELLVGRVGVARRNRGRKGGESGFGDQRNRNDT